jgi:chloramphenicol O-acetyltransferase
MGRRAQVNDQKEEIMFNPVRSAIVKYMYDILKDRYPYHQNVIDRCSHYLVTESDAKQFASLITDIYQLGYVKGAREYMQKLNEQGMNFNIISDDPRMTGADQKVDN